MAENIENQTTEDAKDILQTLADPRVAVSAVGVIAVLVVVWIALKIAGTL